MSRLCSPEGQRRRPFARDVAPSCRPVAQTTTAPLLQTAYRPHPRVHSQAARSRRFDPSSPSGKGEKRIRLATRELELDRAFLGSVPRTYDGINALAVLLSERHPDAIKCAALRLLGCS